MSYGALSLAYHSDELAHTLEADLAKFQTLRIVDAPFVKVQHQLKASIWLDVY